MIACFRCGPVSTRYREGPKRVCPLLPGNANEDLRTEYGRGDMTFPGERGLPMRGAKVESYEIVQDVPRIIKCRVVEYLISKHYFPTNESVLLLEPILNDLWEDYIISGLLFMSLPFLRNKLLLAFNITSRRQKIKIVTIKPDAR